MSKHSVVDLKYRETGTDQITAMLKTGVENSIYHAAGRNTGVTVQYSDCRTGNWPGTVVRIGYLPERELQTRLGSVSVRIPLVHSKTSETVTSRSSWSRRMHERRNHWRRPSLAV